MQLILAQKGNFGYSENVSFSCFNRSFLARKQQENRMKGEGILVVTTVRKWALVGEIESGLEQ